VDKASVGQSDYGRPEFKKTLAMVAKRNIFHGEELYVTYGSVWWDAFQNCHKNWDSENQCPCPL
jgi:hypothetical protein